MLTLVADIETDAIYKPTTIHMVGILDYDTDEFTAYVGEDEVPLGLLRIQEADRVIGHNFRDYDKKQIERLTEGLITLDDNKIDDTLEIARALFPQLKSHKLAVWGDILGLPKLEYEGDFLRFTPEMIPYCERDCRVNKLLYEFLLTQLMAAA